MFKLYITAKVTKDEFKFILKLMTRNEKDHNSFENLRFLFF